MAPKPQVQKAQPRDARRPPKAVAEDPLLKRSSAKIETNAIKKDPQERQKAVLMALLLLVSCFFVYAVQIITWFFLWYHSFAGSVCIFLLCLLASVAASALAGRKREWLSWMGLLCATATIVGVVVGFFCFYGDLVYYYKWKDMHTYTNVGASQGAKTFADAGMFLWSEDSRIDPMRAVGFKSRYTGDVYCVAPIVDSTMSSEEPISYFAIGENCCNARSEFSCDDSREIDTRSSLVVLEPEEIVRPYMRWAVADATYPRYERALKLLEATYNTKMAQKVVLVRWTKDPIEMRDNSFDHAVRKMIVASIVYFVFCLLMSGYIANGMRTSQKKSYLEHMVPVNYMGAQRLAAGSMGYTGDRLMPENMLAGSAQRPP
eukprot:gnl/TRDRNA2_/TRDRNA2_183055_c0_seq1.p1 gnl/TRDRNA2_/TRDRNA2_183055_c0~~gnl/TRDRNA2_/TRDRNA2_183055_c0_seq1.p1  ORF type:complete len:393 (+),score=62.25 gnl/TRDRNA2_/TRDRNA2_183055_c0_seq1:55-1179(+)